VIDPQWAIEPYRDSAACTACRIEHVLETHNHADHVSGQRAACASDGGAIHIHELADAEYPHGIVHRRLKLSLGRR